jgi:thiamine-phosphate pyrophosphorylase
MLADLLDIPVYAIGGISPGNIREIMLSGASGACLMSGLMASEDPADVVSRCRSACQSRQ